MDIADLGGDRERRHPAHPRDAEQACHRPVGGARGAQLAVDGVDLAVEIVDQPSARGDGAAPRPRDVEAIERLAAGDTEQIADRATGARRRSAWRGCGARASSGA
jgi:hypothetical protein